MRKFLMSMFILAGVLFSGSLPASANAAAGLTANPVVKSESLVEKARWGHRRHHGLYFGFGVPFVGYGYGYPRYRYYDDYSYSRPRYYYRSYGRHRLYRHHHRRHHW